MLKSQAISAAGGVLVAAAAVRQGVPEAALAAAGVVVVPLALPLVAGRPADTGTRAAGVALAGAAALAPGTAATLLAAGWLAAVGRLAARHARDWSRCPSIATGELARLGATAFLVVAAAWAVLAAARADPFDVGDTVVLLTAVHFHYAGFAAALLTARLCDLRPVPDVVAAAVLGGPLVVAAGFAGPELFQPVGTAVLAIGLTGVASLTLAGGIHASAPRLARALLVTSSVAVLGGMALAVQWALAPHIGWSALSLDDMARTHGLLNGAGFALAGLAGRNIEARAARPAPVR